MIPYRVATLAAGIGFLPAIAYAQTVRGIVAERSDRAVPGVVVQLLDSASRVVGRALTGGQGEFRLVAPGAGRYILRTMRIGYRSFSSPAIVLRAGDDVTRRVTLDDVAFGLDTVRVVTEVVCRGAADSTVATFAVWEQARTALTAAQVTADSRAISATVVTYDRILDRTGRRIRQQSTALRSGVVTQPWQSLPAATLSHRGYVVADSDGTTYHAPGLSVLLSPEFIEDHCFRLSSGTDAARAGMIGIAFEPTPARRRTTEISGTLWLDRVTSELRGMEYRYVNVSPAMGGRAPSGGEMEFVRLRDGAWAISRWNIRMPVLGKPEALASASTAVDVAAIKVTGGELAFATRGKDTLWARLPLEVSGTVVDSLSGKPVPNAVVSLQGGPLESVSDAGGRFSIAGVLPGEYTLEVRSPSLDSVGAVYQSAVSVLDATSIRVRVPSANLIAATICGKSVGDGREGFGMLVGRVAAGRDSAPQGNVTVMAEWIERSGASEPRWVEVAADARGMFRLCGLPLSTALVVRAASDSGASGPVDIRIPASRRFARAELFIDALTRTDATFSGRVFTDSTRNPIIGAEVALLDLGQETVTNGLGAFRLTGIPAGTHRVRVRRIGYGPVDTSIAFGVSEKVERQIFLERVTALDSMLVTAPRRDIAMMEFADNRKVGLGHFLTRAELEKQEGRKLSEIMAQLPGLTMNHAVGGGNAAWVASSRNVKSVGNRDCAELEGGKASIYQKCGFCYAAVYLDRAVIYRGRGPVPDINSFMPHQIEGIEYYASAAQTPLQYSTLNSACGVVVIHTRRPP